MRKPISSMIAGVAVAIAATVASGVGSAQNLGGASNNKWWPEMLDLRPLRQQSVTSDPMGPDFNYIERFNKLDLNAVKKDIEKVMKQYKVVAQKVKNAILAKCMPEHRRAIDSLPLDEFSRHIPSGQGSIVGG